MKNKAIVAVIFLQFLALVVFAQKNSGLGALLNKKSEFIFPQTADKVSAALNVKAVFYEDANEEKYAKWLCNTGLELYCTLGENKRIDDMSFDIAEDKFVVVSGLPYNLTMNKSTVEQCVAKFKNSKIKKEKLGDDSSFSGGTKLTFKQEKHYVTLLFDQENLLKFLSITPDLIDPAAN